MSAAQLPAALLKKEARALGGVTLVVTGAIVGSAVAGWPAAGLVAFVVGTSALGAASLGHDYVHRTLPVLLAQPIPRTRILLAKDAVLAAQLLWLAVLAWVVLFSTPGMAWALGGAESLARWQWVIVLAMPVLAFCVTPYLTMKTRSALAAVVFMLAVPAALWIVGQLTRIALSGFDVRPLEYAPARTLIVGGVVAVSAVAGLAGRRLFLRLEALDGRPGFDRARAALLPSGVGTERVARLHPPALALVRKELRLHTLAFAVAGLYAAGWTALSLARVSDHIAGQSFELLAEIYSVLVALLVGALASAEERAFGTREGQVMLPIAWWKQWSAKVGVAMALALGLGYGLAIILEAAFPLVADSRSGASFIAAGWFLPSPTVPVLIVLTSLYVSSLASTGLHALLLSVRSRSASTGCSSG